MNVLIVSATTEEILPLLRHLEQWVPPVTVRTLVTGVGQVPTAFHLTHHLSQYRYDRVIQAGIAGSFRRTWSPGKCVSVASQVFADLGSQTADGGFESVFDLKLVGANDYPFRDGRLVNPDADEWDFLDTASAVSSDLAHGRIEEIQALAKRYDPDLESMEGAAFFYVCKQLRLPFWEIRAISNYVEPRDKSQWNIGLAIDNLNDVLVRILTELGRSS